MKIINFSDVFDEPICIALGFFDCLHIGHRTVLSRIKEFSDKLNAKSAVWTFSDNLISFKDEKSKTVFSLYERLKRFERFGIDVVLESDFDEDFKNMSALEFLQKLVGNFNLRGIVAGEDYKFGSGRSGDVATLENFCEENNLQFDTVKTVDYQGERCSTTYVKKLIEAGQIETVNKLLGEDYSIIGIVEHGNEVGRTIGFPTINISVDKKKVQLKKGVYSSYAVINNIEYKCVTNVGARPTFLDDCNKIETYIIGFNGDLYGKMVEVFFKRYLRGVVKFESADDLISQLKSDEEAVCND